MDSTALTQLQILYSRVRTETAVLDVIHEARLECRQGCSDCCVDDLTVFEIEAANIRVHYPKLLKTAKPHAPGKCAFLASDGACRIYQQRPYVCRTQGYPLRWIDEAEQGLIELRDICPLNETGDPVETLESDACWTLGPIEGELAGLQTQFSSSPTRRIALRDLFVEKKSP